MWDGPSNIHYFIDFWHASFGGCGGYPIQPKLDLKDKGQTSKPNKYTDTFKSNLTCMFLSVSAKLKKPVLPWDTVYLVNMLKG